MSKAIERRMVLRDQVTPTMNKINKNTLAYKHSLKTLKADGTRSWWAIRNGMVGVAVAGAALLGSVFAIRELEQGYIELSQAQTKLQAIFKATGMASEGQVESLKTYANALERTGVVADDIIISGMQQLASFNVTSDTVQTLSSGMMDLVAQQKGLNATQGDAVNIANMVGKAMTGQVGALSRVGIIFNEAQGQVLKYGTEQEKAATMAEVLRQNVGGVNAALANTDEGRVKQLTIAMGGFQDEIGAVIVKLKSSFASAFMEYLPVIEAKIKSVTDAITRWADNGGVDSLVETFAILTKTVKDFGPIIGLAAAGIAAYKIYAMRAAIAQFSLNAAMRANPIGFVIGGLMALIGVVVLVRKHKDLLKLKFMTTWNAIAEYTEGGINRMIGGLNSFLSGVAYFKDSVIYFFQNMWNIVVTMAEKKIQEWAEPINAVLRAIGKEEIKVNLSAAKIDTVAPTYSKQNYIKEIEFKRFSDDTISALQEARAKKQQKDVDNNTKALSALTDTMLDNTDAVASNTAALKTSSRDLTGEEIADKLLPRLERVVYG